MWAPTPQSFNGCQHKAKLKTPLNLYFSFSFLLASFWCPSEIVLWTSASSYQGLENEPRSHCHSVSTWWYFYKGSKWGVTRNLVWKLVATLRISALFDLRCLCVSPEQQADAKQQANVGSVGRGAGIWCVWISSAPHPARHSLEVLSRPHAASAFHLFLTGRSKLGSKRTCGWASRGLNSSDCFLSAC